MIDDEILFSKTDGFKMCRSLIIKLVLNCSRDFRCHVKQSHLIAVARTVFSALKQQITCTETDNQKIEFYSMPLGLNLLTTIVRDFARSFHSTASELLYRKCEVRRFPKDEKLKITDENSP